MNKLKLSIKMIIINKDKYNQKKKKKKKKKYIQKN